MDYVNAAWSSLSSAWSTTTNTASDYWSKRPTWLGGPAAPPTGVLGGRRKTHRRRSHKVKRRRTGKKTNGFLGLPSPRI